MVPRRALIAAGAGIALALGLTGPVLADSRMTESGGVLYFRSEDAGIANALTIDRDGRGRLRFTDEADPYGITYPSGRCSPGKINNSGNPVEVFCDPSGITKILVQSGPGEDKLMSKLTDLPVTMEGEIGADTLTTGAGPDRVGGGQGNDRVDTGAGDDLATGDDGDDVLITGDGNDQADGGSGSDQIDTGAGDDLVVSADGYADTVVCGPGNDTVTADQLDQVVDCETVNRRQVAAIGGSAGTPDTKRPVVRVGGSTSQRISTKRRRVSVVLTASEAARVDVSGFLDAGGLFRRIKPVTGRVKVGGGGAKLWLTLTLTQTRSVLRDLRRHRHPKVRLTVSAVDASGNTSATRRLTIALRR